jgi:uncharacterized protein YbjT (DUF2867 family)
VNETEQSKRVAVIAGASGLVGSDCLQRLLQSRDYDRVISLVRRPLDLDNPRLQQITANFAELPPLPGRAGAAVFCALGTTMRLAGSREAFRAVDFGASFAVAKAAAAAGAHQFLVVSSIGANPESHAFYLRVKGELEEALKPLPFKSLHIFRPSLLVGQRAEKRAGERVGAVVAKALDFAFVGKMKKYSAIEITDLAQAMVNAAHLAKPGVHIYEFDSIMALAKG